MLLITLNKSPMINTNNTPNEFKITFKYCYTSEKIPALLDSVSNIQKSIKWDAMDFRIAKRRLKDDRCPKILVKDLKTRKFCGYATIVAESRKKWYVSQIAVHSDFQRKGIGKQVMQKLFEEAQARGVKVVSLDTDGDDEKLICFYTSFSDRKFEIIERSVNRFNQAKLEFKYYL
jgi:ribosomal protein S18 acetylase RimI-like enzyme